ncbi:MAG: O-antigen ligase family protein [Candidatus Uhrbacteria bacterium]|nr:O-antigen ligase family protein [Candidatus Uhrbacteria bacterium]
MRIGRSNFEHVRQVVLDWGLPILFFLLPWQTRWIFGFELIGGQIFEYGILSLYATEALLLILALIQLPSLVARGRAILKNGTGITEILWPTHIGVGMAVRTLAVLFVAGLSVFVAISKAVALVQLMHLGFTMLLFVMLLDRRVDIKKVMIGFSAGLVLPALLGAYQFIVGESAASTFLGLASREAARLGESVIELGAARVLRAYGSFSHPNILGGYLAVSIVGIIGLWKYLKTTREKWTLSVVGFICAIGLVLTYSRSAWIGLAFGLILGGLILINKNTAQIRKLLVPVTIIVIGFALTLSIVAPFVATRLSVESLLEQRSVSERIEQYNEFPSVIGSRWLFGLGIGNYALLIENAYPGREWWEYQPVHNVVLLIIGEIGLVGLIVILWWVMSIDRINFKRLPDPDAVTAFMVSNVVIVVLFFDHYIWSTWSGLALIAYVMALTVRLGEAE